MSNFSIPHTRTISYGVETVQSMGQKWYLPILESPIIIDIKKELKILHNQVWL